MKWFTETFLPSLDEHFEKRTNIWLTEKQVNICRKYMRQSQYYSFLYIIVGDYQYNLSIMKKGYGRMVRERKEAAYH